MVFDCVIVGGGASGMLCAISATLRGKKVIILEHKDRVLKKVLVTGNGRCNFTNKNATAKNYTSSKENFVNYLFEKYPASKVIDFFEDMGVLATAGKNGKMYPMSLQASSIVDAIRNYANFLNIAIKLETEVNKIEKVKDYFLINGIQTKNIVIASGGYSFKELGSDGSGYELAKSLGHSITELTPILVQLRTDKEYIKGLEGIRLDVKLSAYYKNDMIREEVGELLFTPYGISGPTVFNMSYLIPKYSYDILFKVDFIPDIEKEKLKSILYNRRDKFGYLEATEFFNTILPKKLGQFLLKKVGIEKLNISISTIDDKILEKLVEIIKGYEIKCYDTMGFKQAQVTAGGVDTRQVDEKTFMSKLVKNVYFCGEVLDVYGECGGYNLQYAFASGMLVGESVD